MQSLVRSYGIGTSSSVFTTQPQSPISNYSASPGNARIVRPHLNQPKRPNHTLLSNTKTPSKLSSFLTTQLNKKYTPKRAHPPLFAPSRTQSSLLLRHSPLYSHPSTLQILTHPRVRFYSTVSDNYKANKNKLKQFFLKWKPRTADHIIAMVSWAVFGTTFWIIIGTTTLASAIIWVLNTFQFGEYFANKVGDYLTKESGLQIKFESAKGDWNKRLIRLKNVSVVREGSGELKQSAVHLTIEYVDIKLSLLWLLEGRGVLKECKASGIRGVVDRRFEGVNNGGNAKPPRRKAKRGDFVLENLSLSDALITLYLPDPAHRPLPISIYSLNCDWFRKQWIFFDLLSAKSVVGRFDTCLFTFGVPQRIGPHPVNNSNIRELKIDGVPFDILNKNATGPLGWIKEGTLDISLLIALPPKYIEGISETNPKWQYYGLHGAGAGGSPGTDVGTSVDYSDNEILEDYVSMRFECMFNHLVVTAPLYTPHLSYLSNALIHPILSYMNAHSKHIPLGFEVKLPLSEFDGAWAPSEAGFWEGLSSGVGVGFAQAVDEKKNTDTLKEAAGTVLKDVWDWMGGFVPARTPTYI